MNKNKREHPVMDIDKREQAIVNMILNDAERAKTVIQNAFHTNTKENEMDALEREWNERQNQIALKRIDADEQEENERLEREWNERANESTNESTSTRTDENPSECMSFGRPDVNNNVCVECKHIDSCLERMENTKSANTRSTSTHGVDAFGFTRNKTKSLFAHAIYKRAREMRGESDSIVQAKWNTKRQTYYDTFNELRGRNKKTSIGKFYSAFGAIAGKDANGRCFVLKNKLSDEQKREIERTCEEYGSLID